MEAQNDPKKMLVRENTIQEDRVFTVDIIWQNYKGNMSQVMNTNITKLSMQSHFCKKILTKNKSLPWKLLDMFWFENKSRTATAGFCAVKCIKKFKTDISVRF